MDDSALLEGILSDDDEQDDDHEELFTKSRKRGFTEPSSDSALLPSSLCNAEHLSAQIHTTPKRTRVFRHKKIIIKSKSKENRPTTVDLLSELKKTNTTMVALAEKVKKAEKRMRNMEKKVKRSNSSSSSSPSSWKKAVVPSGIRVRGSV